MRTSYTPRHRAPRAISAARLIRGSAVVGASTGLVAVMATGAQAAPAPVAAPVQAPAVAPISAAVPAAAPMLPLPAHPTGSTLRWGSRGGAVKSVQEVVGTKVDGIFGPKTHAAVKRWQGRHGLVANGIVESSTSRHMGLSSTGGDSRGQSSASRSSARSSSSSSSTSGVLRYAQQYTGIMYSWGGTSPSTGFDCSGYIQYVFAKVGMSVPRTAEQQRQATTPVSEPRPGDLVFWGAPAYHNAIYAGDGMIYDSGKPGIPTQKRKMFSGVTSYGRVG
ncbi:NlpC/P60 family protein [soil metagenome]